MQGLLGHANTRDHAMCRGSWVRHGAHAHSPWAGLLEHTDSSVHSSRVRAPAVHYSRSGTTMVGCEKDGCANELSGVKSPVSWLIRKRCSWLDATSAATRNSSPTSAQSRVLLPAIGTQRTSFGTLELTSKTPTKLGVLGT